MLIILAAFGGAAHAQWQILNSGTTADLRGIDNVGGGMAWASGTNGTVLRTVDGGETWQPCAIPPGAEHLDFRGIQAFDANTAIVMSSGKGDLSRLYKTTDGCHTWKLVFTNPDKDGFWDAIKFFDRKTGVIIGDPVKGRLYSRMSSDGGETWSPFYDDHGMDVGSLKVGFFAASNSALVLRVGNPYIIEAVANEDGSALDCFAAFGTTCDSRKPPNPSSCPSGWTWDAPTFLPIPSNGVSSGAFSRAWDENKGWGIKAEVVVGGDYLKPDGRGGTAAYTTDSGKTWQAARTPPHGYRSAVVYDAASKTWITVGPNGTDISTDDGKNWRALHPDPAMHETPDADRNWNALSLPFVVGPHGRIGKLNPHALAPRSDP
ncbi:MAG: YCF48-related protein [Terracidiphilus sp.]